MNIKLEIEYDGTSFFGWQRQGNLPTIQAYIEDVVQRVNGRRTVVYGAGRTDSGVHAFGQVANFYSFQPHIPPEKWAFIINDGLPKTIRIKKSELAPSSFHAQKKALSKLYEYWVWNAPIESAHMTQVYFCPFPLKWVKIEESLCEFLGTRDFLPFQSGKNERVSTERTLYAIRVLYPKAGEGLYRIQVEGNGFLKHMVRNIVGTLVGIGLELLEKETIPIIFSGQVLSSRFRTLPSRGLHLVSVKYAD